MAAILDRTIYCAVAVLTGFATVVMVASVTSPAPASANRLPRHDVIGVDAWCIPATCTSIPKSTSERFSLRFD